MCRKKNIFQRKALAILLIGIFVLSGCGQSAGDPDEAGDNGVNEKTDVNFTEHGDTAGTDENNEQSEGLTTLPEVPVNTKAEDIDFRMEDGIYIQRAEHRCCSDGENIYLAYGAQDLYVMPVGADEHRRMNIDNPDGLYVCNVAIDAYGKLHLLMASPDLDRWFIWCLDKDCQMEKEMDITAYVETKYVPIWFLVDKDGTYYIQWMIERNGILVGGNGELKHSFTLETLGVRWTYEAALGKDGLIYIVYGEWDEKLKIDEFDVENCSIKKEDSSLGFPRGEAFSAMSGGTDTNLLLFSHNSGIWAYDNEKEIMENRVPLSDIDFGSNPELRPLIFLPDGRLILFNGNDTHIKYIPAGR